jgi:hypothetical protein
LGASAGAGAASTFAPAAAWIALRTRA